MKNIELYESVALTEGDGHKWGPEGPLVIYDGLGLEMEKEPVEKSFSCSVCGERNSFDLRELIEKGNYYRNWMDNMPEDAFDALAENLSLEKKETLNKPVFHTALNLSPYFQVFECKACSTRFFFAMGYDEKQPGRYMAIHQALRVCEADELPGAAVIK